MDFNRPVAFDYETTGLTTSRTQTIAMTMTKTTHEHEPHTGTDYKDYNVFRHSLLRYAGYANEIGESFRYQYPRLVAPSYAIALGYCVADAASTGYGVYQQSAPNDTSHQIHDTVRATIDTLTWQSLASVAIPGATINMIVRASRLAVQRMTLPLLVAEWLSTVVGLGSVPLIIHPIDYSVDYVMDSSVRQWWQPQGGTS